MDRFQVHRRVGLTVLVLVVHHLVLPSDNLLGGNVAHFQLAEVGQQLGTDDVVLGGPGVFLEPGLHIRRVEVHEALKGHIQVGAGLIELFPLPSLRLPLGLEAPFLGLLALAVPVGVAVDCPPGVGFFFLIDRHQNHHADRVALGTNRDEREQTNGRLSCKIRFEEEAYYNARGGES